MASGTFKPIDYTDDAKWIIGGSLFTNGGDSFSFGNDTPDVLSGAVRFDSVTIPPGSTITSAFVRLKSYGNYSGNTCNVNLYFNDVDDATNPTDVASADAKVVTAKIDWDSVPAFTAESTYDTPSLVAILQTVISRGGWGSGNHILLLIKAEGESSAGAYRNVYGYSFTTSAKVAELHVEWDEPSYEISEDIGVLSEFDDNFGELNEDVNILSEFNNNWPEVDENISVNSEFAYLVDDGIEEDASVNAELIAEHTGDLSENASVNSELAAAHSGGLSEEASVNSAFVAARYLKIQDTLSAWGTLKWGWNKTIIDSLAIADTASKILGVSVKEWLTLIDTEIANWNGVESVSDSFYTVDILKVVKVYEDLLADGMTVIDAVKISLGLILIDILTCADTLVSTWAGSRSVSSSFGITDTTLLIKIYNDLVADGMAAVDAVSLALELVIADRLKAVDSVQGIGIFQYLIEDGMTLEDIARRFFPQSVSDSFAIADTSLVDFFVLLQISDSFNAADTTSRLLTINQIIADSLKVLDVVTVQQLIQELIQEGLNFAVSVTIDGEVWECWVLNTSSFHPSVYSNYEFNSFAIDRSNNICYGCKSDGIYTLEGSTDNGTPIRAGIILPKSDFGLMNNKKMRKAWFAVDDDNLILKLETESGDRTFKMIDAECSLTRDLKGRRWEISVEGFESIDSLNLVPVILSRK